MFANAARVSATPTKTYMFQGFLGLEKYPLIINDLPLLLKYY